MDEALERLRRARARDPEDVEATRRLEQGLLRAGRRDEVAALYRFKFLCAQRWDDLKPTNVHGVRRCDVCAKDVHFAAGYAAFQRLAALGHCVASAAPSLDAIVDGLVDDPGQHAAPESPRPPCVVDGWSPEADIPMLLGMPAPPPTAPEGELA